MERGPQNPVCRLREITRQVGEESLERSLSVASAQEDPRTTTTHLPKENGHMQGKTQECKTRLGRPMETVTANAKSAEEGKTDSTSASDAWRHVPTRNSFAA